MEMGFEMYTRILEEAVVELKEQEFTDLFAQQPAAERKPADPTCQCRTHKRLRPIFPMETARGTITSPENGLPKLKRFPKNRAITSPRPTGR
ncbi:MAG: hypothetical protein B7Z24_07005 [Pseudomonadales bacterium 32-42-5]|nr:MAG: hypothetical protein B7Z24_07005 [Pseudomonadales bacterium 32-42-5]